MASRRGRPSKFGRPARPVVLTLPENVIAQLRAVHHDLGWAVVSLVNKTTSTDPVPAPAPPAQLVDYSGRRALIVVNPKLLRHVAGVSVIPLADGHGLIALDTGKGAADLELAILDRLDQAETHTEEHRELMQLRQCLRRWRSGKGLRFRTRSIIVVERGAAASGRDRPAARAADAPGTSPVVRLAHRLQRVRKAGRG